MPFQRSNESITLWWCRLSFPKLFEPAPIMQQGRPIGDPRYSALVVLTPEMAQQVQQIEDRLIKASWPQWGGTQPPSGVMLVRALKQGDVVRPQDPNLKGKWFLSANAKVDSPPDVFKDVQGHSVLLSPEEGRHLVYSGCEAHVAVGLYTTELQAVQPQINCGLNLVKLTGRPMPRFDNRQTAEQAFDTTAAPPPAPPIPEGAPVPVSPPDVGMPQQASPGQVWDPNDPTTW